MLNVFLKAFGKGTVLIVDVQDIIKAEIIRYIDIRPSILVNIAYANTQPIAFFRYAGRC
jgi:hypothetical protein